MLHILYNLLQLTVLVLFWPVLFLLILITPKYRRRIPARLGFGLGAKLASAPAANSDDKTIWIHALSVGEITSALPLAKGLRREYPDSKIIVTATTETGAACARQLLAETADHILASPLDIMLVVRRYIKTISPDIFILVETDFWPNLLTGLQRQCIPTILVNGRISQKSLAAYRKYSFFFKPMFRNFSHLCMQTRADQTNMIAMGVDHNKVHTLGNLKFDMTATTELDSPSISKIFPGNVPIIVAGSTHPGEEEIVLSAYQRVRENHPDLYLVIVPRDPTRAEAILDMIDPTGLTAKLRSENSSTSCNILVVDTIGELVECYRYSTIAFVGGSLVPLGGHNPIEPAIMAVPVIFGPHMEDFHEIAANLVSGGGAWIVNDTALLATTIENLLSNPAQRQLMGENAANCVREKRGVVPRHIELISSLL